jgi:hypothetical protein
LVLEAWAVERGRKNVPDIYHVRRAERTRTAPGPCDERLDRRELRTWCRRRKR